jgi:hypothetical protein
MIGSPVALQFGCMNVYYEDKDPARNNVTDLANDGWCPNTGWMGPIDLTTSVTGLTGPVVPVLGSQSVINDTFRNSGEQEVYFRSGNSLVAWFNGL